MQKPKIALNFSGKLDLWRRTFGLIWSSVPGLTVLWGLLLIIQGLLPGIIVYISKLTIDSFIVVASSQDRFAHFDRAVFFLVLMGVFLLLTEITQFMSDWVRTAKAEYFSDYLKNLIYIKSSEVDLEFYDSEAYHDLMEQAGGESQSKPLALLESVGSVIQNAITLLAFGVLLISYGWMIPLLLIIGTLPNLLISLKLNRIYHNWWRKTSADRRWISYFDTMLTHRQSAAEMRLFNLSPKFREEYKRFRKKLRDEKLSLLKRQYYGKGTANILTLATTGFAIGWIALRIFNNLATLGDLAVFYQIFSRGQILMRSFLGGIEKTFSNSLYLENLFAYLDLESKIISPSPPTPFPEKISRGIHFKNITFAYPESINNCIENFDLFIPAGKFVAIVGVNGAGKSTLIKLLCRFYEVQSGSILIDGVDIRQFDVKELRRNISVLFQFPMQYCDTVANNIALGNTAKSPDAGQLTTAAKGAGAHNFILRLPEEYQTLLGNWFVKGSELSGGEWQRIALARAYYRQSQVIVLDEPTSFMDSWSEADWFERFRGLAQTRTGLIITHRFTIAMRADLIYVINDGQIIETGSHWELVKADGFYAESWKNQLNAAVENKDTNLASAVLT